MINKNIVVVIIIAIISIGGYFVFSNFIKNTNIAPQEKITSEQNNENSPIPQTVNKQASFAIFTNGTFRIFTASMYHNLSEEVYIEANNPNIIRVKKTGITWNDFFSTLPLKLTPNCLTTGTKQTFCTGEDGTLKFYLNDEKKVKILDLEIQEGDKLLVTFGNESEEIIRQQLNRIP